MTTPEAFVVVCTDLHSAVGPFLDIEQASKVAIALTNQNVCIYTVIPCAIAGRVMREKDLPKEARPSNPTEPHGYL